MEDIRLFQYPLVLRVGVLLGLVGFTLWYMRRGIQNGILVGLLAGATIFELFKPQGLPVMSLDRIVGLTVFLAFWWKRWRGEVDRLPFDWIERSMLTFLAVALISLYFHRTYSTQGEGTQLHVTMFLRGFAMPFGAYFLVRRSVRNAVQLRSFFVGLAVVLAYLIVTGIAEAWRIDWLVVPRDILNPERGIHFGQVRGVFFNASLHGLAVAMGLPILIWLFFVERRPRRWLWALLVILSVVPVVYTFQRAAWLSAAAAVALATVAWPRYSLLFGWSSLLVLSGAVVVMPDTLMHSLEERTKNKATIDFRIEQIQIGLNMVRDHPIVGVGLNQYGSVAEKMSSNWYETWTTVSGHAHNTFITILAELGLVGFLPYVAIFAFFGFKSLGVYRRQPQLWPTVCSVWAVTAAYCVMMVSIDIRTGLYHNALLFSLWAMILRLSDNLSSFDRGGQPDQFQGSEETEEPEMHENSLMSRSALIRGNWQERRMP